MKLNLEMVIKVTEASFINPVEETWDHIEIDSRRVNASTYFLPILGEVHDGHKFIVSAFSEGATVSFCEKAYFYSHYETLKDYALLLVDNTTKALHRLTTHILKLTQVKVLGITGSVGKTSTKEFVYHVLKKNYKVHSNKGNFNNHIGLPLTVLDLEPDHEWVVLEMGMNHFKEIETLVNIARPDIGLITNIGTSHIGILGSQENIFQAKMEMVTYFTQVNTLILNASDPYLASVKSNIFEIIKSGDDYLKPINIRLQDNGCYAYDLNLDKTYTIKLNVLGKHNIENSLLAVALGLKLKIDMKDIMSGIYDFTDNNKRLQIYEKENLCIISDCYNASQESMMSAIEVLKSKTGLKVAVLGDILELGSYSKTSHEKVGEYIAKHPVDVLYTYGQESAYIISAAQREGFQNTSKHFKDRDNLITDLKKIKNDNCTILVKGSFGMDMQPIVIALNEE